MTKTRSSKVKLLSGKCVNRVVRNIQDFGDSFEGTISVNGLTYTVTRRKHAKSWRVV